MPVANEASLQQAVSRLNQVRAEIAKVIVGQQEVVDGVLICLLAGGHVLLEGVPGLGQDHAAPHSFPRPESEVFANPVHAGPDARRHCRQHDHGDRRARRQESALSARSDFREPGAGRRNQPRHAEDAVRAAGSHAGAHCDQRHHDP